MTTDTVFETIRRSRGQPRRVTAGRLTGQKPALKMKEVWSIRACLELKRHVRDLALFNLAIDTKVRGCDLVRLKVNDVAAGSEIRSRAVIVQKKTGRPVQFEITEQTRNAVTAWIRQRGLGDMAFPRLSRCSAARCGLTRRHRISLLLKHRRQSLQ